MQWFKKHKILTVIGIVVLIAIIGGAAGGGGDKQANTNNNSSNGNQSQAASNDAKPAIAKLGEVARDGKFEFTIASVECGKPSVGTNEYLTKTAQGQFCIANMTIKNIGNEAQYFDSSYTFLYDAANAKYSADGSASIYVNEQSSTFLNQINPGNSVTGNIVFDIPKDKVPVSAELHDSAFSGGVKVNLQ